MGPVHRPGQQRSGLGGRLTEAAIAWLRARSAAVVLLLATDAGRPVYELIGFVAGDRYGSFAWPAAPPDGDSADAGVVTRPMQAVDLPVANALDYAATGERRRGFIEAFASSGWVAMRGADVVGFHPACLWGGGPTIARDAVAGLALFVGRLPCGRPLAR